MPRSKRGGARQGTPGKAYVNRTDAGQNYDMAAGSPAAGGLTPAPQAAPQSSPDDTPMLSEGTGRPDQPLTAGLPIGEGIGPEGMAGFDPRIAETQRMKARWQPFLKPIVDDVETPESVKVLYRYMMGV